MSSYVPPPPPTVWDFVKQALDRHNANRIRIQRQQARQLPNPLDGETGVADMFRIADRQRERQENRELAQLRSGIGDVAEDLTNLFQPAPVLPVPVQPAQGNGQRRGRRRFVALALGPPPLPHELLSTPAVPTSGPTRFNRHLNGIHHEYTYACGGYTIYIHVHRSNAGYAQKAHSKDSRFQFIVGKGAENDIPLAQLGNYGIGNRDVT